ncbi:FGGY family carbohydrate kinase [Fictibacillus enclensis]|nr:FGGY family carbohydrate kinase [Fictibacillus enclensis]MDM5339160.1 FGGY family carbohydrate kinase [Fictibacillus enclensis]
MKYVIGVDLVTSSVKVLLVDQKGEVHYSVSKEYPLIQSQPGFSEQNRGRVEKTIQALKLLVQESTGHRDDIEGLVFTDKCMG